MRLLRGLVAALTAQLGRYVLGQVANARIRTGRAQLSGHTLDDVVFRYLVSVWRAIAPLLSPWCADGDVPSAANLNLYEGSRSHVPWHCDDESLFGGIGDSKLIVSLSLGSSVTFKWKAKSCSDSEGNSCRLHHGDLFLMDGRCQDE